MVKESGKVCPDDMYMPVEIHFKAYQFLWADSAMEHSRVNAIMGIRQ